MKRFYNDVGVLETAGRWQVTLDGRGIKTVGGAPQLVPHRALADALAEEWRTQGEEIDPASFTFRDMADYAIDMIAPQPRAIADKLVTYADTDTLLYHAHPDEPLYARQREMWEPILSAFEAREGVRLKRVSGIIHNAQDQAALDRLHGRMVQFDAFSLAALESLTTLAASLVVGLTTLETPDDPLPLWRAASLEEEWQAELWGCDEEAEERRVRRERDFLSAHRMARLARGNG
jgi:chaperone required for assembly of F1-ATPase